MNAYSFSKTTFEAQKELAASFRKLRKSQKYSQETTAQKSGVSLGSIKRFEQTGEISLSSLLKLAHLFDRLGDFDRVFKQDENLNDIEKLFSKP